jgi:transposase-like protein
MLKAIDGQEDAHCALAKNAEVVAKLKAMKLTRAADLVASHGQETLTYFAFPSNHWRQIKTNSKRSVIPSCTRISEFSAG